MCDCIHCSIANAVSAYLGRHPDTAPRVLFDGLADTAASFILKTAPQEFHDNVIATIAARITMRVSSHAIDAVAAQAGFAGVHGNA